MSLVFLLLCLSFLCLVRLENDHLYETTIDQTINPNTRQLLDTSTLIVNLTTITISFSPSLDLIYDPPSGHMSPTALGVYVSVVGQPSALIYYSFDSIGPTLSSSYTTATAPYIEVDTPFSESRIRHLSIVAVLYDSILGYIRSEQYTMTYYVESLNRPYSYGFFVPGIETSGYFLRVALEENATARAQVVGNQEFADFFNRGSLGTLGTYSSQIQALHLPSLDPDLNGFEGGYAVNLSNNRYYGILVPYHNGHRFFGKVVRVNMTGMANATECFQSYRMESLDLSSSSNTNSNNVGNTANIIHSGNTNDTNACIVVLDLSTIHSNARGFRRGFVGYPYVYLSPGEFNVGVRLNMEDFSIKTVSVIDFDMVSSTIGGFSGGFIDGTWSCFNPFRTYYGPVGGLRSKLPVDQNQLQVYFHGNMVCVNQSAWDDILTINTSIRLINPANISPDYRGFSDAIRVGRYAYLCPYSTSNHVYTGKLVRIYLGPIDIGNQIDTLTLSGLPLSAIVDVLDLTQVHSTYAGYSSIFTSGQYLFLVPYRNANILYNGQRGHGNVLKIDMNNFELTGVEGLDLTVTTRNQIPSFADTGLRGFSYGFASGKYGIYVPFYNGIFNGKAARIQLYGSLSLSGDLQELDFTVDRKKPNIYKGFRGAFVSIWQGTVF